MKVCLFNDSFPPLIDGVVNTVVNYATVIQKKYGDVLVATPKYPGVKDEYPFAVLRYPSINTVRMVGYRTGNPFDAVAMRRMSDFAPDILHSHCPMASLFMARELRNLTGAPIILTYHTKFDIDIKRALKIGSISDAAIRAVVENIAAADEVWAVNEGAGENLKSLGFEGEIRIMPNGVEFPQGAAPEEETAAVRRDYGIPADRPVFLFVGRMMWYKGQKIIIDGLKKIKSEGQAFTMLFVGDGSDLDDIKNTQPIPVLPPTAYSPARCATAKGCAPYIRKAICSCSRRSLTTTRLWSRRRRRAARQACLWRGQAPPMASATAKTGFS